MISEDREWFKRAPASSEALTVLRKVAGVELPSEYFDLLAFSNGGEGPLPISPWNFCLYSAEETTIYKEEKTFEEFLPGFFFFGGNGGGASIAFDIRGEKPWPIVSIDDDDIYLESVEKIAEDFVSFLALVGIENEIA